MEIKEVRSSSCLVDQLHLLLVDSINSGASVGFLTPVDEQEVQSYWLSVEAEIKSNARKLFIACEGVSVIGAVQLSLCS